MARQDDTLTVRSGLGVTKVEDGPVSCGQLVLEAKGRGENENPMDESVRIDSGYAGQVYASNEVDFGP
ncbi:hypothetical protein GUJ93_ZPchr0010g8807 [Zizania palustris]|uniref:Uncharacterized protein n=1 Tax=Zizania palustris TaxID=103762 RepID=A0A8J5WAP3_ZIZPA|nr:hypothetical protein GUJ93_ZPchr0010g8807 [Zizania palustris]